MNSNCFTKIQNGENRILYLYCSFFFTQRNENKMGVLSAARIVFICFDKFEQTTIDKHSIFKNNFSAIHKKLLFLFNCVENFKNNFIWQIIKRNLSVLFLLLKIWFSIIRSENNNAILEIKNFKKSKKKFNWLFQYDYRTCFSFFSFKSFITPRRQKRH